MLNEAPARPASLRGASVARRRHLWGADVGMIDDDGFAKDAPELFEKVLGDV